MRLPRFVMSCRKHGDIFYTRSRRSIARQIIFFLRASPCSFSGYQPPFQLRVSLHKTAFLLFVVLVAWCSALVERRNAIDLTTSLKREQGGLSVETPNGSRPILHPSLTWNKTYVRAFSFSLRFALGIDILVSLSSPICWNTCTPMSMHEEKNSNRKKHQRQFLKRMKIYPWNCNGCAT